MLNDGFGDSEDLFFEEKIRERERLIKLQAAERTSDPNLWDDLLQEAQITVWQVTKKRHDAPGAYINASVANRLTGIATGRPFYGQPTAQGKPSDPLRHRDRDSLDDPDWDVLVKAPDILDRVLLGYHEGEILRALRELDERSRAYVVLRFWGGYSNPEIGVMLNLSRERLEAVWRTEIRPQLAGRLEHLRDFSRT